jgi:nucleoside-diphosphate-sugar epimerase
MAPKANNELFSLKKSGEGKVAFVTGGGGRIGRSLSRALVRNGYTVRALSHDKKFIHTMPAGVIPYVGDLNNKKILNEACKGADVVFHLAAVVSEYKEPIKTLMEVNVNGTENVLEACRKNSVGHFVFTSTLDVYGKARDDVLTEDSELRPTDKYGYSKAMAESKIVEYGDRIDYTILRMATIYGNEFEESYFKLFKAIKTGKAYIIGDGRNNLALVHIEDVLAALLLVGSNRKSSRNVYNLSDGIRYTQEGLLNMAADMLKADRPKRHINQLVVSLVAKNRGLDSDELRFLTSNRVVDISKIKSELGFRPSVDIKDATIDMVRAFMSNSRIRI